MLVHQAFRYELAPTATQRAALANHAGAARWAWNWGLSVRRKAYQRRRQTLSAMDLHRLVVLPRIGRVATKEPTGKFRGRVLSVTCRREADRWYCALTVEVHRPDPAPVVGPVVGIDRGITTFAVCSDGTTIAGPRPLERNLRRLRRRGRAVSRKQPGSRNRARAALALARCHRRVRNQRTDALHKATTALAKAKSVLVVEDLHVAGMIRNRHLARAISDQGWGEFHRQLGYKATWYGSRLLVAPRFSPSSKRCSGCGLVKADLPLRVRVFACTACGLILDRDVNAARNLATLADSITVGVAGSSPETETPVEGAALAWSATAWWNCPR
jgi:putative transposase